MKVFSLFIAAAAAAGTCTDTADHTIWEATGKAKFESDMTTW